VAKRSIRGVGTWRDSEGGERGAAVEIAVDDGEACVTVGPVDGAGTPLPTHDRRIAFFLGRVEAQIRAAEYATRPVVSYFKEPKRRHHRA
jgi:hypothetical protein